MSSSNLPPGCTNADIERAYGGEDIDDSFEGNTDLTDKEIEAWVESQVVMDLVHKALEWAYNKGCQDGIDNEREAQFYEQQHRDTQESS